MENSDSYYDDLSDNTSNLTLPKIEDDTKLNNLKYNKLTNFVRKKYLDYLEKILNQNISACYTVNGSTINPVPEFNQFHSRRYAEILETDAIRSAIVVQLYRKTMLRLIAGS